MFYRKVALCVALGLSSGIAYSAEPAGQDSTEKTVESAVEIKQVITPKMSDAEFQLRRQAMIDDTAMKVKALQEAHTCAKAATTQDAFSECNKQLREAIRAQLKH